MQVIAVLQSEKEAMETQLYESQQLINQLEQKKGQLEKDNQELLIKKEHLTGKLIISTMQRIALHKLANNKLPGVDL